MTEQERPRLDRGEAVREGVQRAYAAGLAEGRREAVRLLRDILHAQNDGEMERAMKAAREWMKTQPVPRDASSAVPLLREWIEHHQPEGYDGIQDCADINDRTERWLAGLNASETMHDAFCILSPDHGGACDIPGLNASESPSPDGRDYRPEFPSECGWVGVNGWRDNIPASRPCTLAFDHEGPHERHPRGDASESGQE